MKTFAIVGLLLLMCFQASYGQKYLLIDNYGNTRWKLEPGDEIMFRTVGSPYKNTDIIKELQDSIVVFLYSGAYVHVNEFEKIYKARHLLKTLTAASYFPAIGFLFSGLIAYPLVSNPLYDPNDAVYLGVGFLVFGQSLRPFHYKKFKIGKNARIRVMDNSFQ